MPRWHELDGGRYLGTDDLVITRDPEEGWVNVGTYRIMVHGPDRLALHMSPGKHGRVHKDKYHPGKPLPIAVSFGHHPINFVVASTDVPNRVNEYDYAGGILADRCKWSKARSPDCRSPPTRRSLSKAKSPSKTSCPKDPSANGPATMRAISRRCR